MVNRANYELYFLLYVDNELSAPERVAVESFVQQHPDLAGELSQLAAATLPVEAPLLFPGKQDLYRQSVTDETLLLYIDNELSAAERAGLEAAVQREAPLQQRLSELRQTVLPVEPVVFEEKEILYRTEKRRVIPMLWSRIAVAVVMCGVLAVGFRLFSGNDAVTGPATASIEPARRMLHAPAQPRLQPVASGAKGITTSLPSGTEVSDVSAAGLSTAPAVKTMATAGKKLEDAGREPIVLLPVEDQIVSLTNDVSVPVIETPVQIVTAKALIPPPIAKVSTPKQALANSDIVYKELDTSDEDASLYIGSMELNKNKVTGLFKKASRLLVNKANNPANF